MQRASGVLLLTGQVPLRSVQTTRVNLQSLKHTCYNHCVVTPVHNNNNQQHPTTTGECKEIDCPFKHSLEDVKECNMYKLGFCIYGGHCRYKHTKSPGEAQ